MSTPTAGLLTNSRLRARRKCNYLEHVSYGEGWAPVVTPEALRFGSLIHTGLEGWWNAVKLTDPDGQLREDDEGFHEPYYAALRAIDGQAFDEFEQARANEILRGYHAMWRADAQRYEVLAVERFFQAPLINPSTNRRSQTWGLAGKVDAQVRIRATGAMGTIEHKTTSEDVSDEATSYWVKLAMDQQLSIYTLGAISLGYEPQFTLYDVLRKPQQKPKKATPPEKRKYKQRKTPEQLTWQADDERLLYANLRARDETAAEYGTRIRELLEKDLTAWFKRREVARVESQLHDFLANTWIEGHGMRAQQLASRYPRNPDACHGYGTCWLWAHCAHGLALDEHPDKFRRKERPHEELPPSQIRPHTEGDGHDTSTDGEQTTPAASDEGSTGTAS